MMQLGKGLSGAAMAVAVVVLSAQPASAQIERFTGTIAKTGGVGSSTTRVAM